MTHEELRKECVEILGSRFVKRGITASKKVFDDDYNEIKDDEDVLAMLDAMMEVAAKAWQKGYETSWLDDQYPKTGKSNNPYLKPE